MQPTDPVQRRAPIDPAEAPYLATQLERLETGHPERIHPSTLASLRRRGYVDRWDRLTDDGVSVLFSARIIVGARP